ncbi:MAG: hypothetical protein DBX61_09470 [Clostridiales bacterium]|nr:MAG: hypothetical protein DBX61_09470 [Clostridiales bacterium]
MDKEKRGVSASFGAYVFCTLSAAFAADTLCRILSYTISFFKAESYIGILEKLFNDSEKRMYISLAICVLLLCVVFTVKNVCRRAERILLLLSAVFFVISLLLLNMPILPGITGISIFIISFASYLILSSVCAILLVIRSYKNIVTNGKKIIIIQEKTNR